jgi:hypothetical protein
MADAGDLKSLAHKACGFKSRPRHHRRDRVNWVCLKMHEPSMSAIA